jgi:hypothetical protein
MNALGFTHVVIDHSDRACLLLRRMEGISKSYAFALSHLDEHYQQLYQTVFKEEQSL